MAQNQYTYSLKRLFQRSLLPLSLLGMGLFNGCGHFHSLWSRHTPFAAFSAAMASPVPQTLSDAQLERIKPNEVGLIPILEYHNIHPGRYMTCRPSALFRQDLQTLYRLGYRPISMREYLADRIALPAGKKPVILTFDDALLTQFRYLPNGRVDPNCAVGILLHFHEIHPDWALRGVFFVVPTNAFGNRRQFRNKLLALQKMGFEVANHTYDHKYFNRLSDAQIEREIALGKASIDKLDPKAETSLFAIPGGCAPRSHHWWVMCRGTWHGISYKNEAVFLAYGNPAPAPCSRHFNPYRIPRIVAYGGSDGIGAWLHWLGRHPHKMYVSDGDPNTITVPADLLHEVNKKHLHDLALRCYGKIVAHASRHIAHRADSTLWKASALKRSVHNKKRMRVGYSGEMRNPEVGSCKS